MRRRGDLAAHADDIDDHAAPACAHALHDGIEGVDVGKELRVHSGAPIGGSEFVGRRAPGGAGGIYEEVDGAELGLDRVYRRERGGGVDEIGGDPDGARQAGQRLVDVGLRPRGDGDFRALRQQRLGAGEAKSLRAAGHQRDTAVQCEVHVQASFA
jgi:hypothetical protein